MMMKIRWQAIACAAALALTACADSHWAPASVAHEKDVIVAHAYDGPVRPLAEVATVFAVDGGNGGEAQWICSVDGKDLQQTIRLSVHCPSVVYLAPGRHLLGWRYHSRVSRDDLSYVKGSSELPVNVQAGRVYKLVADGVSRTTNLVPRSAGYVVRFSDICFGFSDTPVPN